MVVAKLVYVRTLQTTVEREEQNWEAETSPDFCEKRDSFLAKNFYFWRPILAIKCLRSPSAVQHNSLIISEDGTFIRESKDTN